MKFAVADLGTNTFHLLIADSDGTVLSVSEFPVLLGQSGSKEQVISTEALKRMEAALEKMQQLLMVQQPAQIRAVATSAIRTAANASEVQAFIKQYLGIIPELISGDQEAQYIYAGVNQTLEDHSTISLVMDIGGGSTEFIIGCGSEIFWKQSFLLGAARLKALYNCHDPATDAELYSLNEYIHAALLPLRIAIQTYNPIHFIGAAGAFETIAYVNQLPLIYGIAREFPRNDWENIYMFFRAASLEEKRKMPGMPEFRVPMMLYALELVKIVVEMMNPQKIYISPASLKEGILKEMLEIK